MAMTIEDIRRNYPQYSDMSDIQLADALHRKYYSDLPKEQVYEKLNLKTGGGFESIGEDVYESVTGTPEAFVEMIKGIPSMLKGAGSYIAKEPLYKLPGQAALAGAEGATAIASLPHEAIRYLGGKLAPESAITRGFSETPTPYELLKEGEEYLGVSQEPDAQAFRGLVEMLLGAKGLSKLKTAKGRTGAIAAQQGGKGEDPLQAALLALAGEGAVKAPELAQKARPSRFLKTPLSPEELEKSLAVTSGTETALGDVIESPFLKHQFENVIAKTPFSGAEQAMQRTAANVTERGENVLKKIIGKEKIEDVGLELNEALNDAYKDILKEKDRVFEPVNKIADKYNVTTARPQLVSSARKLLAQMDRDPHLAALKSAEEKSLIKQIAQIKDPDAMDSVIVSPLNDKPFRIKGDKDRFSIKETEFLKSDLRKRAAEARAKRETAKAGILERLATAAENDIVTAIDESGAPGLKSAREGALEWYKNNYVPFEEPEIVKFTIRGGDPDTLANTFLKTSRKYDRANLLGKLTEKLPQDKKQLLPYAYFSQAFEKPRGKTTRDKEWNINPLKLRTLYDNLSERQLNHLIKDKELINQFNDYTQLAEKNIEPLTMMFNPKTGARVGSSMPYLLGMGSSALGSLFTGSVPLGIASSAIPLGLGRYAAKKLTSEKSRQKLIKKMIDQQTKQKKPDQTLLKSLMAELTRATDEEENEQWR